MKCHEILRTFPARKSLKNLRHLLDKFVLTKSCYWTVSNFSDPWESWLWKEATMHLGTTSLKSCMVLGRAGRGLAWLLLVKL